MLSAVYRSFKHIAPKNSPFIIITMEWSLHFFPQCCSHIYADMNIKADNRTQANQKPLTNQILSSKPFFKNGFRAYGCVSQL